ncbi:type II toxin-antitoxin system VapC family toxin [Kocuria sp.]|uniref:type II toxin-antitoxin system VapC family toxin n=1 Tax=Kocuria sp. TaxID=1871328 RepID=UPI0026DEBF97|nr:PIN domain-containing protein [Kocuria sp.]MDO5619416.1 PIN domain-containing protein [Kocuria sp.]
MSSTDPLTTAMTNASPTDLVVVDTNVLITATSRARTAHREALDLLNFDTRRLAITSQIMREYLATATRPAEANGLGMSGAFAVENLDQLLEDMVLLPENSASASRLKHMIQRENAQGKQVHDANVVAVALEHGANAIVTANIRHFQRFSDLIAIEPLRE